jgi:ABC-type branched-subunit amino acid transport system substrate-binding protein
LIIEALKRIPGEPTREALLDAITNSGAFDLGGLSLKYGPDNNQGTNQVFFTVLQQNGTYKSVDRLVKMAVQ